MFDLPSLTLFIVSSLALLVIPGPAVLYIVTRSIDQGRAAGFASVLGIAFGTIGHILAAALGFSALLLSSALAFNIVKLGGAAYLIYLGVRKLMEKAPELQTTPVEPQPLSHIFRQGIIVNLLNPKTALFFFAFLPQFADPARGSVALQIILLGVLFTSIALCSDSLYALAAGTLGNWLKRSRSFWNAQRWFSGTVYILLGVTTALSGSGSKSS